MPLAHIELFGRVLEAVEETASWGAARNFGCIHFREVSWIYLAYAGREYYRFAFLDGDLEIPRNPKILAVGDSSFKVFHILDTIVPVWFVYPLGFAVKLHIKRGETFVEACCHAIGNLFYRFVYAVVGLAKIVYVAERKERPES